MKESQFNSLWIDSPDALRRLDELSATDSRFLTHRSRLFDFIKNGYVIIPGAVSHELIDAYQAAFKRYVADPNGRLLASVPTYGPHDKSVVPARETAPLAPLTKYLDTYWYIPEALPVVFNEAVGSFLDLIFEETPFAFQGLHFEVGSTQAIHQDTAYVVAEKPLSLAASWVALEDVKQGAGELVYYEGSHALPDWLYSGKFKHFNHERDKHAEHLAHLDFLREESEARGYPFRRFLPKKGDVLIWAADLAHGGAQIENSGQSRRSLVTHFCPKSLRPHYFKYLPEHRKIVRDTGMNGYVSSFYYEP